MLFCNDGCLIQTRTTREPRPNTHAYIHTRLQLTDLESRKNNIVLSGFRVAPDAIRVAKLMKIYTM